jgi:predicted RNase H-related nuclease YkuK (DUF458 family)
MTGFKKITGEKITELGQYVKNYMDANPQCILTVGCDSICKKRNINYISTIVFVNPGKGAHVIIRFERIDRKGVDFFTRLWNEVEKTAAISMELGQYVNKDLIIPSVDLNSNSKYKSHQLYAAAVGYLTGLGFKTVYAKPESYASSSCADYFGRN